MSNFLSAPPEQSVVRLGVRKEKLALTPKISLHSLQSVEDLGVRGEKLVLAPKRKQVNRAVCSWFRCQERDVGSDA